MEFFNRDQNDSIVPSGLPPGLRGYTDEDRDKWWNKFGTDFGSDIRKAAEGNCVPIDLLANMIAHEQMELAFDDMALDGITGGGVGPAQISPTTAIKEGVTGLNSADYPATTRGITARGQYFEGQVSAEENFMNAVTKKLNTNSGAAGV